MNISEKVAQKMKEPNVLEQVQVNKKNIEQLYKILPEALGSMEAKFREHTEILNAVVSILGIQPVFEKIKANRIEIAEKDSEVKKAALESQVREGKVIVAEEVVTESIIVGTEVDKDGNLCPPERAQLLYAELNEDLAKPLLGRKVGDVVETPLQTKFTIKEIYNIVLQVPDTTEPQAPQLPEVPTVEAQSNASVN